MPQETGLFPINSLIKVKYLGPDDPLMLKHNKVYSARVLKRNWYGIIDETGEEYAYPPECFEIIQEAEENELNGHM